MRRAFAALALLAALTACDLLPDLLPVPEPTRGPWDGTWVAVTGPRDWQPPEDMVLEVGDTAWSVGGVTAVETDDALRVRVVSGITCRVYADFTAPPGTAWVVRFADDGSARVENWTDLGMDTGPALGERDRTDCPTALRSALG